MYRCIEKNTRYRYEKELPSRSYLYEQDIAVTSGGSGGGIGGVGVNSRTMSRVAACGTTPTPNTTPRVAVQQETAPFNKYEFKRRYLKVDEKVDHREPFIACHLRRRRPIGDRGREQIRRGDKEGTK